MADPASHEREILKAALGRTEECLSPEALEALSANGPDPAAGAAQRRHLDACARCRNELALLQEFQAAAPRPDETASVAWMESELRRRRSGLCAPAAPRRTLRAVLRWRTLSLAAASLVVAVTAGMYFRYGTGGRPPGAEGPVIWRSQQFQAVSPAGDVAAPPAEFQWEPVAGSATYQVRLMEVDRTELWSVVSFHTAVSLPDDIRKRMTPGRTFLWEVIARNTAGEKIGATNLQSFHISVTTR